MLRIYDDVLQLVRVLNPLLAQLSAHSPDLADQGKRALNRVPLRIAEGSYARGKNRAAHYHGGAGSLNETLAVFDTAEAARFIAPLDPEVRNALRRCRNTLFKNAR